MLQQKSWKTALLRPVWLLIGIFLIGLAPLMTSPQGLQLPSLEDILHIVSQMFQPGALVYEVEGVTERALFPFIWNPFLSSFSVLALALVFSLITAILLAGLAALLPASIRNALAAIANLLQTIPDIVYVILFQLFVLFLYRQTHIVLVSFTGAGDSEALLIPSLVLMILPTVYLLRLLLISMDLEKQQPYFEMAQSKGLSFAVIIYRHVFRNLFVQLAYHTKFILGLMVSNLFIIEYLFNNLGLTSFLLDYAQPPVFIVAGVLLFLPIYLFLKIIELLIYLSIGEKVEL